ncbi:MAG: enoyl-CoA hydratase/isomerase family protein [Syntrophales bacterium]|nr:enoyl-CoA hydratase/isomerase family protein [Syntrophales bacterium]
MSFIIVSKDDSVATLTLSRGKVNALNESAIDQINSSLIELEKDETVKAIILTGQGNFFSFGFDIPEFLSYSKDSFTKFLTKFTDLYTYMFLFPKPVVAALNGHTMAGGCMLATTCDYRIMVSGKAKIALNEIGFGSTVLAGSVEMLKYCVGQKNAQSILYGGSMYSAEEANQMGLVDRVSSQDTLMEDAGKVAHDLAKKDSAAFRSVKGILRKPVAEEMAKKEKDVIREFVDIWYSEKTWNKLKEITIR